MNNIGLTVNRYETGKANSNHKIAVAFANRLNQIISSLVELDENIDAREFDIWRGMAAGAQAQGSWGNLKGKRIEVQVKSALRQRLREKDLIVHEKVEQIQLKDGRVIIFADEPDIAIYLNGITQVAIEIKGGIDTAAILERIGAAVKSLSRAREENANALTILFLQEVSLTQTAITDLNINRNAVNHWFTVESILNNSQEREKIFQLIGV